MHKVFGLPSRGHMVLKGVKGSLVTQALKVQEGYKGLWALVDLRSMIVGSTWSIGKIWLGRD